MHIIEHDWKWAHALVHRNGPPPHIIWHHAAAKVYSPEDVHRQDISQGWSGIGYHFYVRKDGCIHRGRPEWAMGAHARGYNDSLGVCAEGAYHIEKEMPAKQLKSMQELHAYLARKYPRATDRRHKDVNATDCPGKYYPYKRITSGVTKPVVIKLPVPAKKPPWWRAMLRWLKRRKQRH